MIPKVITPFTFEDRHNVVLVEAHSKGVDNGWMRKYAAAGFEKELKDLKPEKGYAYLHMLALGDGEWYGANRNGDYFPKKANENYHNTFVKHAHVYKHHENKDPKKASGDVLQSTHSDPMKRVELLTKVSEEKWADELEDLANGKDIPVSMSCTVPYDVCSICENKAPSRKQYCDHLKYAMTSILEDGRQVYAINTMPTFFDISRVIRPADRTAYVLKKAASSKVASGAELAEEVGLYVPASVYAETAPRDLQRKVAIASKLAEIEKEVDGVIVPPKVRGKGLFKYTASFSDDMKDIDDEDVKTLSKRADLWSALSEAKVSLPVTDFIELITGKDFNSVKSMLPEIKSATPGMFGKLLENNDLFDLCSDSCYDPGVASMPTMVSKALSHFKDAFSLAPEKADKRMTIMIIRGGKAPQVKSSSDKTLSSDARALLNEYAKYKISLVADNYDPDFARLSVLQNYV